MLKSLNIILDLKRLGRLTVSAISMAPFPVPNIKYPDRVCMPDEGLKFTAINPCSFVQLENILSFTLKRVNSFSVLITRSVSEAGKMQ